MKRLMQIAAPRNASIVVFGIGILLVFATVVLSVVPPPPSKANTGAPIWLAWALLMFFFGLALRSGRRVLWIATAVIAVPAFLVNLPFDLIGNMGTWVDFAANGLALLVALASVVAGVSALTAVLTTHRRVDKVAGE